MFSAVNNRLKQRGRSNRAWGASARGRVERFRKTNRINPMRFLSDRLERHPLMLTRLPLAGLINVKG
jgi:hypothetical protein